MRSTLSAGERVFHRLQGIRKNIPDSHRIRSTLVEQYHAALAELEREGFDVGDYRVPEERIDYSYFTDLDAGTKKRLGPEKWVNKEDFLPRIDALLSNEVIIKEVGSQPQGMIEVGQMPREVETTRGTYQLLDQIGQGGAGRVFAAKDSDGDTWAIKILDKEKATAQRRKRFQNEIRFGQKNAHKHIITIFDAGISFGSPFYVMPRLDSSLRVLLKIGIAPEKRLIYFTQILDGMEAAHLQRIAHRDLKPENILYDSANDRLVVADFGIAEFRQEELWTLVETRHGERLANFDYAAPEQRARGNPVDHRADIYALGLILNELFTGEVPHGTGCQKIDSIDKQYEFLDAISERMRRQAPDDRFQTIEQIKLEILARQKDAVSLQKLSELRAAVIPTQEIDDPLILSPITVAGADYLANNRLEIALSQAPNDEWKYCFHRFQYRHSSTSKTPSSFNFQGKFALVEALDHEAKSILEDFKRWLPGVTRVYENKVRTKIAQGEGDKKKAVQKAIAHEERRQRLLKELNTPSE